MLDKWLKLWYNSIRKKRKGNDKMFCVEIINGYGVDFEEFETLREAEIFCGEHGISCSEIFED